MALAVTVCLITACLTTGCQTGVSDTALQKENKELETALAKTKADRKELKDSVSKMHMQMLEKDA
ncbi:MAG: hypothetical protein GWN86_21285, partial [Desulfobacterales bacterium]|nr:hypothetical protein [Desulfobacterales bacterium]